MGLLDTMLSASGGSTQDALAERFGLSKGQVNDALAQLTPALKAGVKRNVAQENGLDNLFGALSKGNHSKFLDNPQLLKEAASTQEGNAILGHLLGSKETSREVANQASAKTGIDAGILKQMLPVAATMLMGSLSKNQGDSKPSGGMLSGLLDSDGDGSMTDDAMGMLKKLF